MNETLIKALETLDSSNDNHWTTEGLPKLEALRFAYGSAVSREEVEAAAPGYTRTNRQATPEQLSPNQSSPETLPDHKEGGPSLVHDKPVGEIALRVECDVSDVVTALLSELELTPVEALSDEDLQNLADNHASFVSADRALIDQLTERAHLRARYLSTVADELQKRNPPPSMADAMAAFRNRVTEGNTANLAANKPRVMQRTPHPLLKG